MLGGRAAGPHGTRLRAEEALHRRPLRSLCAVQSRPVRRRLCARRRSPAARVALAPAPPRARRLLSVRERVAARVLARHARRRRAGEPRELRARPGTALARRPRALRDSRDAAGRGRTARPRRRAGHRGRRSRRALGGWHVELGRSAHAGARDRFAAHAAPRGEDALSGHPPSQPGDRRDGDRARCDRARARTRHRGSWCVVRRLGTLRGAAALAARVRRRREPAPPRRRVRVRLSHPHARLHLGAAPDGRDRRRRPGGTRRARAARSRRRPRRSGGGRGGDRGGARRPRSRGAHRTPRGRARVFFVGARGRAAVALLSRAASRGRPWRPCVGRRRRAARGDARQGVGAPRRGIRRRHALGLAAAGRGPCTDAALPRLLRPALPDRRPGLDGTAGRRREPGARIARGRQRRCGRCTRDRPRAGASARRLAALRVPADRALARAGVGIALLARRFAGGGGGASSADEPLRGGPRLPLEVRPDPGAAAGRRRLHRPLPA